MVTPMSSIKESNFQIVYYTKKTKEIYNSVFWKNSYTVIPKDMTASTVCTH